jgi:hypothetical protein
MAARTLAVMIVVLAACKAEPTPTETPAPTPVAAAPQAEPAAPVPPPIEQPPAPPAKPGCWETHFGTPPAAGSNVPSLASAIDGCPGCETLKVGPKATGLHVEVLRRVHAIVAKLPAPEVDEPVLWINSGARQGDPDASMHNQALGIDAVICGMDTRETAKHLRAAGFTCVIEYYDGEGRPCHFAHADLRATQWASGAYAKGGRKARSCPKRAASKSMNCDNSTKRDWTYSEG